MKGKLRLVGVVLALVLSFVVPASTLAAKPAGEVVASGSVDSISAGTVTPAGNSGRWVVLERQILGHFEGDGIFAGSFTLTYKANVDSVLNQAGNVHGKLVADDGSYVLNLAGSSPGLSFHPSGLPVISINGRWTQVGGPGGRGTFEAWFAFMPTPDGHVAFIVTSGVTLYAR